VPGEKRFYFLFTLKGSSNSPSTVLGEVALRPEAEVGRQTRKNLFSQEGDSLGFKPRAEKVINGRGNEY